MTEPAFNIDSSFPLPARPLNQTELAEVTGADLATISRLVSDGHVSLTDDWREQLRQLYRHWSDRLQAAAGMDPSTLYKNERIWRGSKPIKQISNSGRRGLSSCRFH